MNMVGPTTATNKSEDRDLPTVREYELEYNKVYIVREDPFGLWKIKYDKGKLPEYLSGFYTSADRAERQLLRYLDEKNKTIAGVETHKVKSKTL